jgi:CDP-diacylglycerol--glycerol-3-phosphate 3-phosphatidyltransferase
VPTVEIVIGGVKQRPSLPLRADLYACRVTVPNWISTVRIALVPLLVALMLSRSDEALTASVFVVAAASDKLDGYLARSRGAVTTFGKFLDSLADKVLVSCALIALVSLGSLPAWVAMVVVAREFAVTGLRLVAAPNEVVEASRLGKLKTTAQSAVILVLILSPHYDAWTRPLVYLMVFLTVWSGLDYFVRLRHHLLAAATEAGR